MIVTYIPFDRCDKRVSFTDTVIKKLQVLKTDHGSRLEGNYRGFLDSSPNKIFTVSIKYWKYPGDAVGRIYLRNYVDGCTGDGLNSNIPFGTGYEIISGYKNFNMVSYPCNAPGNFRGFGFLSDQEDSITIMHFGYSSAVFVPGDTTPH